MAPPSGSGVFRPLQRQVLTFAERLVVAGPGYIFIDDDGGPDVPFVAASAAEPKDAARVAGSGERDPHLGACQETPFAIKAPAPRVDCDDVNLPPWVRQQTGSPGQHSAQATATARPSAANPHRDALGIGAIPTNSDVTSRTGVTNLATARVLANERLCSGLRSKCPCAYENRSS